MPKRASQDAPEKMETDLERVRAKLSTAKGCEVPSDEGCQ